MMSIKEAIGSWIYYNQDKNLVISNGDIYRADVYFSKFFPYSRLSQEQFDEMIQDSSQQLIGLETQKEWMLEGKEVSRQVVPYVISYQALIGQRALLVLNIRVQYQLDTGVLQPFFSYNTAEVFSFDELCSHAPHAIEAAHFLFQQKNVTTMTPIPALWRSTMQTVRSLQRRLQTTFIPAFPASPAALRRR